MLRATSFAHAVFLERLDYHYQAMTSRKLTVFEQSIDLFSWPQIVLHALICKEH